MKYVFPLLISLAVFSGCKDTPVTTAEKLNQVATQYVKVALVIGLYDDSFVDAYYGPDSLKPAEKPNPVFPKDSLLQVVASMKHELEAFNSDEVDPGMRNRAMWINDQLTAFDRRIRIYTGEYGTFDEEAKDLFGVVPPTYNEDHFVKIVSQLDQLLPGEGSAGDRFQALANHFIIPKEKLDTVFKAAIAESRRRTRPHFELPANEDFKLEFVTNKPWNGYNWYKGHYQSLIQINTDLNIFIDRAIDVGSHESYPGHHVYNMLLEKNLYNEKGLVEMCMYPLFSPQSLIAEGSANYGIDLTFPGDEKVKFAKEVLLPLAGLDTTGISLYFKALAIKQELNYARNEVARQMLAGTMDEAEALRWLETYALFNPETANKSVSFIKVNRTYVINYNYGMDLIAGWIDRKMNGATDDDERWKIFGELLSNEVRISDLTMQN